MEFRAILKKHEGIDAVFVEIPEEVLKEFGRKRFKAAATFDGVPYRGCVVTMRGCTMIGVTKKIRRQIAKGAEDVVLVALERDEEPRIAEPPEDFSAALKENTEAASFFEMLSYTRRKSFITTIESAGTKTTREKRIRQSVAMLAEKKVR